MKAEEKTNAQKIDKEIEQFFLLHRFNAEDRKDFLDLVERITAELLVVQRQKVESQQQEIEGLQKELVESLHNAHNLRLEISHRGDCMCEKDARIAQLESELQRIEKANADLEDECHQLHASFQCARMEGDELRTELQRIREGVGKLKKYDDYSDCLNFESVYYLADDLDNLIGEKK